jgi:hypothetical protein
MLSAITERVKIFTMTAIRLSGSQLHAARVLVGLARRGGRAAPACASGTSIAKPALAFTVPQ